MKEDDSLVHARDLIQWILPGLLLLAGLAAFLMMGRAVPPITTPGVTVEGAP